MPRVNLKFLIDDEYEQETIERRAYRKKGGNPGRKSGKSQRVEQELAALAAQQEREGRIEFSYHASRHERQWIADSLGGFYEDHMIADVLRLVKGGKEASVYQCLAGVASDQDRYLAAKVYRPRQFRNLKKDHIYREGRADLDAEGNEILDHGMMNAMRKRSGYGLELLHTSWIEHEYRALHSLHAAGADVPAVYARGNNAVLMSYIGGHETAAPTLNSIDLDRDEAGALFGRVVRNIEIMLAQERVHGDLSAYNILYWEGEIALIDFPQVINPHENRNAYQIFERDVIRVSEYFIRQGVKIQPRRLAAELWTSQGYRLGPDVHPGLLDEESEADREYWKQLQG